MLFKSIVATFSGLLLAQGALSVLTADQVVSNINVVTSTSKDTDNILGEVTVSSSLDQVNTKGQATLQGLQTIINDLSTNIQSMQGDKINDTGNAAQSIASAYTGFVDVHQALLSTLIGKHSIFAQYLSTAPFAATLKSLEASIDSFSFALIDIIPSRQSDVMTGNRQLDDSLGNAITIYQQVCVPSPLFPNIQPICVSI